MADSAQVPRVQAQYTKAIAEVYLLPSECNFNSSTPRPCRYRLGVLGLDSGYLSGVGQVNIPSCSTYTNILLYCCTPVLLISSSAAAHQFFRCLICILWSRGNLIHSCEKVYNSEKNGSILVSFSTYISEVKSSISQSTFSLGKK